ncbi:hypothetical protein C4577_04950 [Candidatus Parcubacteria bacterium]|nr:MAG: hypothetical protein C4577_04950 [Candidatus Parcubacteria bacterium]
MNDKETIKNEILELLKINSRQLYSLSWIQYSLCWSYSKELERDDLETFLNELVSEGKVNYNLYNEYQFNVHYQGEEMSAKFKNKFVIKQQKDPNVKEVHLSIDEGNGAVFLVVDGIHVAYITAEGKLGRYDTPRLPEGLCPDANNSNYIAFDNERS